MGGYIVLAFTLGLPLLLGLFWRVSSSHLFFSVMAGELLARYFGHSIGTGLKTVFSTELLAVYGEPIMIVAPVILTAFFLRKSLSRGKALLHFVPLLITGAVLAAFMLPMLPETIRSEVSRIPLGGDLLQLNSAIIGWVVGVQLIALWLLNRRADEKPAKN